MILTVTALTAAGISVYTDLRWGKIKNFVTFPLFLIGLTWHTVDGGLAGLLLTLLLSTVISLLACQGVRLGCGDIKLIAGIVACIGPDIKAAMFFLAWYYVVMALDAIYIRLKIHNFNLIKGLKAIWQEMRLEICAVKSANLMVHGEKLTHPGAPAIFIALVASIIANQILFGELIY